MKSYRGGYNKENLSFLVPYFNETTRKQDLYLVTHKLLDISENFNKLSISAEIDEFILDKLSNENNKDFKDPVFKLNRIDEMIVVHLDHLTQIFMMKILIIAMNMIKVMKVMKVMKAMKTMKAMKAMKAMKMMKVMKTMKAMKMIKK